MRNTIAEPYTGKEAKDNSANHEVSIAKVTVDGEAGIDAPVATVRSALNRCRRDKLYLERLFPATDFFELFVRKRKRGMAGNETTCFK